MNVTWNFGNPSEKQREVMHLRNKYIAYGGARGGGKSWVVRKWATLHCLRFRGIRCLIVRATYPELYENHIRPLIEDTRKIAKYNEQKKTLTFVTGSTIRFGYCRNEKDMEQYQGAEYDLVFIDEAGNIPEECIKRFQAIVRGTNSFPKRTMYTLNPGGRSHGYFKRLFIDRDFREGENPEDYAFVQALVTDNTALMQKQPEYIKSLESLPERLRKAWLEGRWDVFSGQFFEDFVDSPDASGHTHVIAPFPPPPNWPVWRSYDYGYNKPFACLWWTLDTDGVLYLMMELYGCDKEPNQGIHWTADRQFDEIARIEREHPWLRGRRIHGVADPAIWNKESTGLSIADAAARRGVYFDPANNDRINGWAQCHNRLALDENGRAMMYVFENCSHFRRTIPTLIYDEHRPEDLDSDGEDHIADAWRYLCMANPIAARNTVMERRLLPQQDPLELYESTRKARYHNGR